jgi:hypothetical protein
MYFCSGADGYNLTNATDNGTGETMESLQGEPTLEDLFSDPIVHLLMERDAVDPDDFRMFLEDVRSALDIAAPASSSPPRRFKRPPIGKAYHACKRPIEIADGRASWRGFDIPVRNIPYVANLK